MLIVQKKNLLRQNKRGRGTLAEPPCSPPSTLLVSVSELWHGFQESFDTISSYRHYTGRNFALFTLYYSRHPLSRTPKGPAKKFEIAKNKKKNKKNSISHTRKYINLTCNTLRGKIETKGTLLGEKSKMA